MKAKLLINEKEIEVEISEKELKKLKKRTGYERVEDGESYYTEQPISTDFADLEEYCHIDDRNYDEANYFNDKKLRNDCKRVDILRRKLRRFAVEHREKKLEWDNIKTAKYLIAYDHFMGRLEIRYADCTENLGQYFDSEETAELAIETFREELEWYFTEFKDSL